MSDNFWIDVAVKAFHWLGTGIGVYLYTGSVAAGFAAYCIVWCLTDNPR